MWSPNGGEIAWNSPGRGLVLRKPADGSGTETTIFASPHHVHLWSWSPENNVLVFEQQNPDTGWDVGIVDAYGGTEPELLLASAFDERHPMLSPDGRWLAYSSNESGRFQIYVQPFPGPGSRTQVSGEGGSWPVWSRKGDELFYSGGHDYFGQHDFISVGVVLGSSFEVTRERKLFGGGFAEGFDVAPDGQSFYVMEMRRIHSSGMRIQVVLNWSEELERLVSIED